MSHTFGSLLRHLRRRQELTQEELAARLGYSRSMIAALESNRRLPDLDAVADHYLRALELTEDRESTQQLVDLALVSRGLGRGTASRMHAVSFPAQNHQEENRTENQTAHRLPLSPTPLIGREREVQRICDSILQKHNRLITLVGPPGIGKTRLSLEAASRLQLHTEHGACFIPLAGATEPDHLIECIIDALGVQNVATSSVERLIGFLRRQNLLLVLDNFEQIIEAAPLVARILAECAGVRVIVTSREPLHLRAEHLMPIRPLSPQAAADLFRARMDAAGVNLALEEMDHNAVDDICQRLDCLPLALELCAGQTNFYSLIEILDRLQSHLLDTLEDGATDLPQRHYTLRAAIGSSYDALTNDEQSMLRTLSVFVGGCTPQAAIELWSAGREEPALPPEKLLRSLSAKSLLQVETTAHGDKRLHLFQSIWEYARDELINEDELQAQSERHSKAMLSFMQRMAPMLREREAPKWLRLIHREWDNFNAALAWSFEHEDWQAMATQLLALHESFDSSARQNDYFAWYMELLPHVDRLAPDVQAIVKMNFCFGAHTGEMAERRKEIVQDYLNLIAQCQNPLIKATLLTHGAVLGVAFPDPLAAKIEAVELAKLAGTANDRRLIFGIECTQEVVLSKALFMLGCNLYSIGRTNEATTYMDEVLRRATQSCAGHDAFATGYLGRIALSEGRLKDASEFMESAVRVAAAAFDISGMAAWRSFLGMVYVYSGNLERASAVLSQAWEESCIAGNPFFTQVTTLALAELALASGELDEARAWIAECIRLSEQSSHEMDWRNLHRILLTARLAATEGRDADAASLYGLWHAYNKSIVVGAYGPVVDNASVEMAEVRQRLGESEYQRIYLLGSQLPRRETLNSLSSYLSNPA